jgi:hypothetical protein
MLEAELLMLMVGCWLWWPGDCSWPIHTMARSHPYPGHHSRHRGTRPLDWLDSTLQLSTDYHHRPGTPVWVITLPLPGQTMWNSTFPDNHLSSCSQWTLGTLPPHTKDSHHVPRRSTQDKRASPGSSRHSHLIQTGSPSVSSWTRLWRTLV